jgi:hypothetical protein
MLALLLASLLSLFFFSAVLRAELRGGGDPRRVRELGLVVLMLALAAIVAGHAVVAQGGPETAGLSALLSGG